MSLLAKARRLIDKVLVCLGQPETMTDAEQEISDSLKSLKTLRCIDGRVSISPSEVLDQPGYREARVKAAALISGRAGQTAISRITALSDLDLELAIARRLVKLRREGLGLNEALSVLRLSLAGRDW